MLDKKIAEGLLHFVRKYENISDQEFEDIILPKIVIRSFKKKEPIVKPGEVDNHFNLVYEGIVRKYFIKGKEEVHTQIARRKQIIFIQDSFFSRTPSCYFLEALEPTVLISIKYDDLESIYSTSAKMQHLGRVVVTHIALMQDSWHEKLVKKSSRERFMDFVNKNSDLIQKVPQKYLASLLNIKPETFSRYKHLLKSNPKK